MLYSCLIHAWLMDDGSLGGCCELADRLERLIQTLSWPGHSVVQNASGFRLPGFLSYFLKTISPQGINVD